MEHPAILSVAVQPYSCKDDGTYPNNPTLPVLYYPQCIQLGNTDAAAMMETLFRDNDWGGDWRNGIYDYHHYHSTSHEVLGIYKGQAKVQLGGPHGVMLEVSAGDVLLIPAGVAHRNLGSTTDFGCVGAYPPRQKEYDILRGKPDERPDADQRIRVVALPDTDPVYGPDGPMTQYWIDER